MAPLAPPPPPAVAPVISEVYSNDLNGNHIADEFEAGTAVLTAATRSRAAASGEDLVDVELIFREPVTQEQIDSFLALGGEIDYMYQAISYGWNGCIARQYLDSLPAIMGPSLVLVESFKEAQFTLDVAGQTGRVRPVWQPGFADKVDGFQGDPSTTIAFIDSGVDGGHVDLAGRCVYWRDFTNNRAESPVDYEGHGTMVASVAAGTGAGSGSDDSTLSYTYWEDGRYWLHATWPVPTPAGPVTLTSDACWMGGYATLQHMLSHEGTNIISVDLPASEPIENTAYGRSPLSLVDTFDASDQELAGTLLISPVKSGLEHVVIVGSVTPYPSPGDGFDRLRGVAPGCMWACAKVSEKNAGIEAAAVMQALDQYVVNRVASNIKILSLSFGYIVNGVPGEYFTIRDKVTTVVRNGIVVVCSAGNRADEITKQMRNMADPARTALVITVGASNDENALTEYSTYGYENVRFPTEDYKPDLLAPGGSYYYSAMMAADTGSNDGAIQADKNPHDYTFMVGTSFSSPFAAGCAGLVIEAMERRGMVWDFTSDECPRYVKMVLCATACETNADREGGKFNPTLQRASTGSDGFPAAKDRYEGYGLVTVDAAVEAISLTYSLDSVVSETLGDGPTDRRVWARTINLSADDEVRVVLTNPAEGDFDCYLYSTQPTEKGAPVILASSTNEGAGMPERLEYQPEANGTAFLVVKRVSGHGTFELEAESADPVPPSEQDGQVSAAADTPVAIAMAAADDGLPSPPGALTYVIASLPAHGQLKDAATGLAIVNVPAELAGGGHTVVYQPESGREGDDSLTFHVDDGGTPPFGGISNTATVHILVVNEMTQLYRGCASADDAQAPKWSTYQRPIDNAPTIGQYIVDKRFQSIQIPQGAEILGAQLKIQAHRDELSGAIDAFLHAEATDDAADFSADERPKSVCRSK